MIVYYVCEKIGGRTPSLLITWPLFHLPRKVIINGLIVDAILKFVGLQLDTPVELLATDLTLKKLKVQVSSLVVFLVTVRDKRLPTEATYEGLFSRVSLNVMLVARRVLEDFKAVAVRTLVLLCTLDHCQ